MWKVNVRIIYVGGIVTQFLNVEDKVSPIHASIELQTKKQKKCIIFSYGHIGLQEMDLCM